MTTSQNFNAVIQYTFEEKNVRFTEKKLQNMKSVF